MLADLKHNIVFCGWHFENDVTFFGTIRFHQFVQVANGRAGDIVYQQTERIIPKICSSYSAVDGKADGESQDALFRIVSACRRQLRPDNVCVLASDRRVYRAW